MTRACRPTLFDAAADPELLVAMLLANLTSPALWESEARIAARIDAQGSPLSPGEVMLAIQSYADQHLFHISPLGVADTWGQLDLDEERARLGSTVVDYLTAGTRGHLVQAQARQIADIDDALAIVQRIEGADSAVACTHRIAERGPEVQYRRRAGPRFSALYADRIGRCTTRGSACRSGDPDRAL